MISKEGIDLVRPPRGIAPATAPSTPGPVSPVGPDGPAQRRELPATYLKLEPKPLSFYDDNPVFNDTGAAYLIGVTPDCLKKWRQRNQGPDYIRYGPNGPVRYALKAIMQFRDNHTVKLNNSLPLRMICCMEW